MDPSAKSIADLSRADLLQAPIWEWASDDENEDETFVRPVASPTVPLQADVHVACTVRIAAGSEFVGFVSFYAGEREPDGVTVVGDAGEYFPIDTRPARKHRAAFEAFFGCTYDELFPVSWQLCASFEGENQLRDGTVERGI